MKQRFDAHELFALRNDVPIDWLISCKLRIDRKSSEGLFRFECPCCKSFHTATNPVTNLARCFGCKTNWNPIDIVMTSQQIGFVESVKFLQRCYSELGLSRRAIVSRDSHPSRRPLAVSEILRHVALQIEGKHEHSSKD